MECKYSSTWKQQLQLFNLSWQREQGLPNAERSVKGVHYGRSVFKFWESESRRNYSMCHFPSLSGFITGPFCAVHLIPMDHYLALQGSQIMGSISSGILRPVLFYLCLQCHLLICIMDQLDCLRRCLAILEHYSSSITSSLRDCSFRGEISSLVYYRSQFHEVS